MVAIVIVNYNGDSDTFCCITSLLKSSFTDFRIIIVDNASRDDSISELTENLSSAYGMYESKNQMISFLNGKIIVLLSTINGGFAFANNIGAKYAIMNFPRLDFLWFLNNDTIVNHETLANLVNSLNWRDRQIGMLGNKLLFLDNPTKIQAIGGLYNKFLAKCTHIGAYELDNGQYDKKIPHMDYIIGASMFVRKSFILDVGYMCEDYFLYFEELDWILRGKKKGWKFSYVSNAVVLHKEGGSTKVTSKKMSELSDVCQLRSRILFTKKNYPYCLCTVYLACFSTIVMRFIRGDIKRAGVLLKNYISLVYGSKK